MKSSADEEAFLETPDAASLRASLLDHYDRHARDLPWRRDTDPYRVLVSEVMLQQTRVETVRGYYDAWLGRFPTIESLAEADEDEVLKAWEGLGYYRRARNLHGAARVVCEERGGTLPDTVAELRTLPGVGAYTAGAVASIAFGVETPAVDGNVTRVLARLFDVPEPRPAWLRETAAGLLDPGRPGDWNQALMELGATVCTPRSPRCGSCPVSSWCAARAAGTQLQRPARRERPAAPVVAISLAVIHDGSRVLLERRPRGGLLGGLWAFPEARVEGGEVAAAAAAMALARERGLEVSAGPRPLPERRHRFTHLDARYLPWSIRLGGLRGADGPDRAWVDPRAPGERALPRAQQRVLASWLDEVGGAAC